MRKLNWTEVSAASFGPRLEPGAYEIVITDVEDNASWEVLKIVYDVASGEKQGIFSSMGPDDNWKHQLSQSYSDKAEAFFKSFLEAVEKSNPGFSIAEWQRTSDEREFIGKRVGVLLRNYHGVSEKGKPFTRLEQVYFMPVEQLRTVEFETPEDRWSKQAEKLAKEESESSTSSTAPSGDYYDPIPFS